MRMLNEMLVNYSKYIFILSFSVKFMGFAPESWLIQARFY